MTGIKLSEWEAEADLICIELTQIVVMLTQAKN